MASEKKKMNVLALILGSVLVLYSIALLLLLAYGFLNSIKDKYAFNIDQAFLSKAVFEDLALRKQLTGDNSLTWYNFDNYVKAFFGINQPATINGVKYKIYLPEMFLNSIIYAGGCAFFATLTPCLVAYLTTKYNFRFNSVIYTVVIFVMVTPIVGSLPSQIRMSKLLGLFDSFAGLWFMSATFLGTYYLVFHGIFKGLSWEYAEAAFIDGASHFKVMTQVMFPLIKNTFFVVMLLNFISLWNDYQRPWIFLPNRPTAAVGVQFFSRASESELKSTVYRLAGGYLMLTPILIVFLIFRDKFVGNLTVGGIKG